MCVVTTELSYGTLIRCFDLAVAARAHEELLGPVLAVRMIAQRQREGTLATEDGRGRMEKVPSEVWSMMKRELVRGALAESEVEEVWNWRCENGCEDSACWECRESRYDHLVNWSLPRCQYCADKLFHYGESDSGSLFGYAQMDRLLGVYGLARKQDLNKCLVDDECLFDFDAAYLIGRPTKEKVVIDTIIKHDEPHRMLSQAQVPTLVQDVSTDARLRALISDYQLPTSKATIPTYPGYTSTADKRGGGTWMMWTTCESCM